MTNTSFFKNLVVGVWFALTTLLVYSSGVGLHYKVAPYLIVCSMVIIFVIEKGLYLSNKINNIFLLLILLTFITSYHYFDHLTHHTAFKNYLSYSIVGYTLTITSYHIVRDNTQYYKLLYYLVIAFYVVGIFRFFRAQGQLAELHANTAYYYILMPIPLILSSRNKTIQFIVLCISTVLCVLSIKRAAVIGIAIVWIIYLFHTLKSKNKKTYILLMCIALIVGQHYLPTNDLLQSSERLEERLSTIQEDGGSGRVDIIEEFFNNSYSDLMQIPEVFIGNGFEATLLKFKNLSSMHNDFIEVLYTLGFIGLFLLVYFYYLLLKRVIQEWRSDRQLKIPYICLFILFILFSFVSCNFNYFTLSAPLFISLGIFEALCDSRKNV